MGKKTKIREEAEKLNPIDDLLFRKMAEEKDFCEEILRVILGDNALTVTEAHPQYAVTNLQGRSVILDAKCIAGDGKHINVEVQKSDHDDHQRRVRYHGSVLTANITENVLKKCQMYVSYIFLHLICLETGNHCTTLTVLSGKLAALWTTALRKYM